jgi:hypothetical protein
MNAMSLGLITLCLSTAAILATPWPTEEKLFTPNFNEYSKPMQQSPPASPDIPKSPLRGIS